MKILNFKNFGFNYDTIFYILQNSDDLLLSNVIGLSLIGNQFRLTIQFMEFVQAKLHSLQWIMTFARHTTKELQSFHEYAPGTRIYSIQGGLNVFTL